MKQAIKMLIELAPLTKILYSSDAHTIPDLYYVSAKWTKELVYQVLKKCIINNELTIEEAKDAAANIFQRNAIRIYKL